MNKTTNTLVAVKDDVIGAAKQGAKIAAATKASDRLALEVGKMLNRAGVKQVNTPAGKHAVEALTPVLVDVLAIHFADHIPQADRVRAAAQYAIQGKTAEYIAPLLAQLLPLFSALASSVDASAPEPDVNVAADDEYGPSK